jgi:hypothetical protein
MKKSFICSLICHNGIVGGMLYIEEKSIVFKTNKLTVDRECRRIMLPTNEISKLRWERVVFPIAKFSMVNGEQYEFLLFNKKRFNKYYDQVKQL